MATKKKPVVKKSAPPARRRRAEVQDEDEEEFPEVDETEEEVEDEVEETEEEVEESDENEEEQPRRKKSTAAAPPRARREFDFKSQMGAEDWQKILDQMSSAGGPFYYLKDGKTRLRLVPQPGSKTRWFIEALNTFNGRTRPKVIFFAVLASGKGVTEEMKNQVRPVVAAKTVVTGILNLLAEGYDLLSPRGYGLTISRTGTGLETAYSILPSQEPKPLPKDLTWPEIKSLNELADLYEQKSAERDSGRKGGGKGKRDEGEDEGTEW